MGGVGAALVALIVAAGCAGGPGLPDTTARDAAERICACYCEYMLGGDCRDDCVARWESWNAGAAARDERAWDACADRIIAQPSCSELRIWLDGDPDCPWTPSATQSCAAAADCVGTTRCEEGWCRPYFPCGEDEECRAPGVCEGGACAPPLCVDDTVCEEGHVCTRGRCVCEFDGPHVVVPGIEGPWGPEVWFFAEWCVSASVEFDVCNEGCGGLIVYGVRVIDPGPGGEFEVDGPVGPFTLALGDCAAYTVTYRNLDGVDSTGALVVESSDPERPVVEVALSDRTPGEGNLCASPKEVSFEATLGEDAFVEVSLWNCGDGAGALWLQEAYVTGEVPAGALIRLDGFTLDGTPIEPPVLMFIGEGACEPTTVVVHVRFEALTCEVPPESLVFVWFDAEWGESKAYTLSLPVVGSVEGC